MKNFKPPDSSPGKFQTLGSGRWGEGMGGRGGDACKNNNNNNNNNNLILAQVLDTGNMGV